MTTDLALTAPESAALAECESIISRGLKSFVEVGNALLHIRDGRLYRAEYGTFEAYCREKWGWERRHAYRLIDGARAAGNVSNWTQTEPPANEAQARPLTKLPPAEQAEAWEAVQERVKEEDREVTAADVKEEVERRTEKKTVKVKLASTIPHTGPKEMAAVDTVVTYFSAITSIVASGYLRWSETNKSRVLEAFGELQDAFREITT